MMIRAAAFAALLLATTSAIAQSPAPVENSRPQPLPIIDTIPAARDIAYPGTIKLDIDATDTRQRIFKVKETIPVAEPGHMVLLFPAWLPGNHAPRGQIEKLAGLHIRAGGKELAWKRDPVDVFAFHVIVPDGAKQLDVAFQFLSATDGNQGRVVVTPAMMNLQWNSVSLYPAGYFTRQIPVEASVTYPDGWTARSGLPATHSGSTYRYQPTNYQVLVDSPVFAGKYFKEWALSPRVDLNVFADKPSDLEAKPEQIDAHKRLVDQAVKLFGAQHYDHYEFLLALTDEMGGIGLEHHRSSENGTDPGYFTDWDTAPTLRNLLAHEFTHSWDGKFRRGADLWTPDFRMPMRDSLLWVYEGQTQFWGYVLGARSGLNSKEDTLGALASIAAAYDNRAGHQWRPLVDTTNDPVISARRPKGWSSWQRSEDYYNEGLLVWMEVDATLRRLSGGTKSMDDFARAFFGINDGDWGEVTYTRDDVVATLNAIQPYDWAALLDKRLDETADRAPLDGLTGNGYKLVYTDQPTNWFKSNEKRRKITDLSYSLGMVVGSKNGISDVSWDGPAFNAGLTVGDDLVAVNGMAVTGDRLKDAVADAAQSKAPIKLLVKSGDHYREVAIDYHQGLRYPRLEKTAAGESGLDRLLEPR